MITLIMLCNSFYYRSASPQRPISPTQLLVLSVSFLLAVKKLDTLNDCDFIVHCNRVAILYVFSRAEQNIVSVIGLAIVLVI